MKERPIIFSTEMVRAILDGRKSQTRRVIKPQPSSNSKIFVRALTNSLWWQEFDGYYEDAPPIMFKCPYGQVGDQLWVRENWSIHCVDTGNGTEWRVYYYGGEYKAVTKEQAHSIYLHNSGRPSIHMPRWASRITLEITEVRVERLQEISFRDCEAEGIYIYDDPWKAKGLSINQVRMRFARLWDSLNAKHGYGWETNPWVWVISFRNIGASRV